MGSPLLLTSAAPAEALVACLEQAWREERLVGLCAEQEQELLGAALAGSALSGAGVVVGSGGEVTPGRLGNLTAGIENIEQPEISRGSIARVRRNMSSLISGFRPSCKPTALAASPPSTDILVSAVSATDCISDCVV